MKFEEYLSESGKTGKFAWKAGTSAKWKEGIKLPFVNAKAIAAAVNSEKEDIGSISALFLSYYSSPHAKPDDKVEIQDAAAKLSSHGETVEVEFTYNLFKDRDKILKAKITIQDDE